MPTSINATNPHAARRCWGRRIDKIARTVDIILLEYPQSWGHVGRLVANEVFKTISQREKPDARMTITGVRRR
jgi:hypothetical protein